MISEEISRVFIAVDINHDLRRSLSLLCDSAKRIGSPVKWVKPDLMHITLFFAGDIFLRDIQVISSSIDELANRLDPFSAEAGGIGFFGHPASPKVVWAGIREGAERLKAVHSELRMSLELNGYKDDGRDWIPHITLGRFKSSEKKKEIISFLSSYSEKSFGTFRIDHIVLYKSLLKPNGPVYTPIHVSRFGKESRIL